MARLFTVVLAILGIAALVWFGWDHLQPAPVAPTDAMRTEDAAPAQGGYAARNDEVPYKNIAAEREDATAPHPTTGALHVTITWGESGSPAPGIPVSVRRRDVDSLLDAPRGVTDAQGEFLFEGLLPGNVHPTHEYGDARIGNLVKIVAGEIAKATLGILPGITVQGRIVDAQSAAVANADVVVWTHDGSGSQVVGTSAEDGTFLLRHMRKFSGIGARKPGYEPTVLQSIDASVGAVVEITIVMHAGGGSLAGVVLDPHGEPVVGAAVRAGTTEQNGHLLPDGSTAYGPRPELVFTDENGRFGFASVVTGDVPLVVRTRQFAPWFDLVTVQAGRNSEVTVHLLPGVALFGRVLLDDGSPVADIDVEAGDYERLARRRTHTAADGSYRLEGLAAGAIEARAGDLEPAFVRTTLQLVVGEEFRWDPVLVRGQSLRGQVLRANGEPAAGLKIWGSLDPWQRGDDWIGLGDTDAEGRFELINVPAGRAVEIKVYSRRSFVEALLHEVRPGPEELVIRLGDTEWGQVVGTVHDPDGDVLQEARIGGFQPVDINLGQFDAKVDPATGAFDSGPCPPGSYRVSIKVPGFPPLRFEHELGAGETWDIGTVRMQHGGHVAVQLIGDAEMFAGRVPLSVYHDGAYLARVETEDGFGLSTPLLAGDYELFVAGSSIAAHTVPFSIRTGADTRIDVPVTIGTEVTIGCTFAGEPPTRPPWADVEVRDANGALACRGNVYRHSEWQKAFRLAPGRYVALFRHEQWQGNGEFEVGDQSCATTIRLEAR